MMENEIDEIESGIRQKLQVALIAGLRVGQELAIALKERLDKIKHANEVEAKALQRAFESDRDQAVAEIAQTAQPAWWENATPDEIGRTAALAQAWEPHYPEGTQAKEHLFQQLEDRYGIRTYETGTSPELIAAQLKVWEQDRTREVAATGAELSERAAAEVRASTVAHDALPEKKGPVRFDAGPEGNPATELSVAEVLARIEKMPPRDELTKQQQERVERWALQAPEVNAAIWRKYPDLIADSANVQAARDAERERDRAAGDLAAADQHVGAADRLASEARGQDAQASNDPNDPHRVEAARLRTQEAGVGVDAEHAYDSAERRLQTAETLEAAGVDEQAIEAHMISDTAQGRPARDAVKVQRAMKARPVRAAPSRGRGVERGR